ncbi:MAG: DUF1570 domain-containing protein [Sinobacterium sp.]|nr:DUF1570 domain-containing protein [Sinobacterium sp.]
MFYTLIRFTFLSAVLAAIVLSLHWKTLNDAEKQQLIQRLELVQETGSLNALFNDELLNTEPSTQKPKTVLAPPVHIEVLPHIKVEKADVTSQSDEYWQEDHLPKLCGRVKSRAVKEPKKQSVYSWKDKNGRSHFSDKNPEDATGGNTKQVVSVSQFTSAKKFFSLNIVDDKADMTLILAGRIQTDVNAIYSLLSQGLGFKKLREIDLTLRLFIQQKAFQAYKNKVAPRSKTNSGFYLSRLNEASVVQWPRRPEKTYSVIRHESSHVIMAGLFGSTPRWFNEGLAEYFELMNTGGQYKYIDLDKYKLDYLKLQLKQARLPSIEYLWSLNARQFYQNTRLHYSMAWSVIHFMLSEEKEKSLFSALIQSLYDKPCQKVDMVALVNTTYPGGLEAFEKAYVHALKTNKFKGHYY